MSHLHHTESWSSEVWKGVLVGLALIAVVLVWEFLLVLANE